MLVLRHRLAVAGVITAAAIAVPAAAFASGPGSPSPPAKPVPASASAQAPAASASKSAAARSQPNVTAPAAEVDALVTQLGISHGAAQRAFDQLGALSGEGGIDPASPGFAVIARDLGVSPARLAAALVAVKQSLAGQ